jgi:hypothetical protein
VFEAFFPRVKAAQNPWYDWACVFAARNTLSSLPLMRCEVQKDGLGRPLKT